MSFELLIEGRGISQAEKIHYLKRYLSGSAKEAIEGYSLLPTKEAYEEAKKQLKKRYGDSFAVSSAYRKRLAEWPRIGPRDGKGLQKLCDCLKQCTIAMKHNKFLKAMDDITQIQLLIAKMPDWVKHKWFRESFKYKSDKGAYPTLSVFTDFLAFEAEVMNDPSTVASTTSERKAEEARPMKRHVGATSASAQNQRQSPPSSVYSHAGGYGGQSRWQSRSAAGPRQQGQPRSSFGQREQSRPTVGNYSQQRQQWRQPCCVCGGDHQVDWCRAFQSKSPHDQQLIIRDKELCFACLRPGHAFKDCRQRLKCKKCEKMHPTSMHIDYKRQSEPVKQEKTVSAKSHVSYPVSSQATSMIVPVYLSTGNGVESLCYAMIDTQSDSTWISEDVAKSIGAKGPTIELSLSTMSKEHRIKTQRVNSLFVRGYGGDRKFKIAKAYTRRAIPCDVSHIPTCDTASHGKHYKHLMWL